MTNTTATELLNRLMTSDTGSVYCGLAQLTIKNGRYVMTCRDAEHSINADGNAERLEAHWNGFLANTKQAFSGQAVAAADRAMKAVGLPSYTELVELLNRSHNEIGLLAAHAQDLSEADQKRMCDGLKARGHGDNHAKRIEALDKTFFLINQ